MFDRSKPSYHDNQVLGDTDTSRYLDKTSAKYLKSCFNPEFPMRCKERESPKLYIKGTGLRNLASGEVKSREVV